MRALGAVRGLPVCLALAAAPIHPVLSQTSGLDDYTFSSDSATRWRLPRTLREISGLAATPDNRVFAHNDERATIYEIDYREGRLIKAFAMGERRIRDDFEGITIVDERFYLVTSDGGIYESREGEDGERMLFNFYGTGVGRRCEVEGLTFEPSDRSLLLLCKSPRDNSLKDVIAIFRWSLDHREMAQQELLTIPRSQFTAALDTKSFSPSGIERHPRTGNYWIVAAAQSAIAEVTPQGRVIAVRALPNGTHRQVEGITILSDLTLLLADEGRNRRARLTLYSAN